MRCTANAKNQLSVEDLTSGTTLNTLGEPDMIGGTEDNTPRVVEDVKTVITGGGRQHTQTVIDAVLAPSSDVVRKECVESSISYVEEDITRVEDDGMTMNVEGDIPVVLTKRVCGGAVPDIAGMDDNTGGGDILVEGAVTRMGCDIKRVPTCKCGWKPKLKSYGNIYNKIVNYHCSIGRSIRAGTMPSSSYVSQSIDSASDCYEALGQNTQFESESESRSGDTTRIDVPDEH